MATVVSVQTDPPEVNVDDVEEFLATDDLFVEYFNYYLALPAFPEPLCFNPTSGGFEVVSKARRELAQQIKAAIRSQGRTPPMYHVTKQHAFRDITLIPIVPPEGPEKVEIDTAFSVTTLNKEQGIHWVKAERLPTFLQSDCYFEYRLASILSQAQLLDRRGEFVVMRLDARPRVKKERQQQEEVAADLKDVFMKNMYVCLGCAPPTDTEAWFSQAKMAHGAEPSYACLSRPVSASRPALSTPSGRSPSSASLVSASLRHSDSGIGSPSKSSVFSGPTYGSYDSLGLVPHDVMQQGRGSGVRRLEDLLQAGGGGDKKPYTPRPGEPVCVTDSDMGEMTSSTVYFSLKTETTDTESGLGDVGDDELDDEKTDEASVHSKQRQREHDEDNVRVKAAANDDDVEADKTEQGEEKCLVLTSLDHLTAVVVGAVMKKAMAELSRLSQSLLERDPRIVAIFPAPRYAHISTDMLDNVVAVEDSDPKPVQRAAPPLEARGQKSPAHRRADSDVDSLLDSDEDYEEEDGPFFRKHKPRKTYSLRTRRGVQQFKSFLQGTAGQSLWHLWLDIDRLLLAVSPDEHAQCLARLREKYLIQAAQNEITARSRVRQILSDSCKWTVDRVQALQVVVTETLLLYWAPRFLLRQLFHANPEKYEHYRALLNIRSLQAPDHHTRPTPYLPLRPKSCQPRLDLHNVPGPQDALLQLTAPRVGMRRVYGPSAIEPTDHAATSGRAAPVSMATKKPRDFLLAHLKAEGTKISPAQRPLSASLTGGTKNSHRAGSKSVRPPPTLSPHRSRPYTAKSTGSTASGNSWESVSVDILEQHQRQHQQRPATAASRERPPSAEFSASVFLGGARMEAMLEALHCEKESGHVFRRFLQRSDNKLWRDALLFWEDVQNYRLLFYREKLDLYNIRKHSKTIYSQYLVRSSPKSIGCSRRLQDGVQQCLAAPQEELFDDTEEEVLDILYEAWMASLTSDTVTYGKVELTETKRHLETKSTYVMHLQRSGLIKERPLTPEEPADGEDDPVYDTAVWEHVPEEFQDYTLDKLVHNRLELEHFKQFLAEKYADTDLKCWMDIEAWRRLAPTEERKRDMKAKDIRRAYLTKKYFFGPNSPAGKSGQNQVMQAGGGWGKLLEDRPPSAVLLEAQKYVRERLQSKWLPLFLATESFVERQRPRVLVDDVVDDVLIQKRRRSLAVWKMLESRWVSSSKEILTFRKALMNPVTSQQFRRFVSIKSDNLENNVLFWQEVQKYKQMHHTHTEESMLTQKINTIINCFIDSQIPPSLQVDLPQEMADRILDRKYERGPYLFREAQLAVFRILFGHWKDFCDMRMKLADDKVLPTIERLRRHAKVKERQRQAEVERKLEQERLRAAAAAADDNFLHDPFASQDSGDEMEAEASRDKGDRIEFSYANYLRQLKREELLNNIDESIFSSLTDAGSSKDVFQNNNGGKQQQQQINGDTDTSSSARQGDIEGTQKGHKRDTEGTQISSTRNGQPNTGSRKSQQQDGLSVRKDGNLSTSDDSATDTKLGGSQLQAPASSQRQSVPGARRSTSQSTASKPARTAPPLKQNR